MTQTILITLNAGLNTSNFSLYSNLDGYQTAFEINVSREDLVNGYVSTLVPSGATIIRVKSNSDNCTNFRDITISGTPTTVAPTTATPTTATPTTATPTTATPTTATPTTVAPTTVAPTTATPTTTPVGVASYNTLTKGAGSVNEGGSISFELNTSNIPNGTTVGWTITGVSSADIIGGITSGVFTINSNVGYVGVTVKIDNLTEGPETLTMTLNATDSASRATGSLTTSVLINDTSLNATTSTTSTTTVAPLPMTTYCYNERWTCDDIEHPLGGGITYWDAYGVEYIESGLCYETTQNVLTYSSSAVPQKVGLDLIVCPTSSSTTTTTTSTTLAPSAANVDCSNYGVAFDNYSPGGANEFSANIYLPVAATTNYVFTIAFEADRTDTQGTIFDNITINIGTGQFSGNGVNSAGLSQEVGENYTMVSYNILSIVPNDGKYTFDPCNY